MICILVIIIYIYNNNVIGLVGLVWKSMYERIQTPIEQYTINNSQYNNDLYNEIKTLTNDILTSNTISSINVIEQITSSPLRMIYFLKELNAKRAKYKNMNNIQYTSISKIFIDICYIINKPIKNILENNNSDLNSYEKMSLVEDIHNNEINTDIPPLDTTTNTIKLDKGIDVYIYHPYMINKLKKYFYILNYIIILSNTFYGGDGDNKESLVDKIKSCEIWDDKLIWELMIINRILLEKVRYEKSKYCIPITQQQIETIENSCLLTYLFHLDAFNKSKLKQIIKDHIFELTYIKHIEEVN